MSRLTSCMMSYKMAVSNNRGSYGTLSKNILGWGTQYSEFTDPSIFNTLVYNFRHKNTVFTINSPSCSLLSGIIVIIISLVSLLFLDTISGHLRPLLYHLSITLMLLVMWLVKDSPRLRPLPMNLDLNSTWIQHNFNLISTSHGDSGPCLQNQPGFNV